MQNESHLDEQSLDTPLAVYDEEGMVISVEIFWVMLSNV